MEVSMFANDWDGVQENFAVRAGDDSDLIEIRGDRGVITLYAENPNTLIKLGEEIARQAREMARRKECEVLEAEPVSEIDMPPTPLIAPMADQHESA
jgi:hypothetical protein